MTLHRRQFLNFSAAGCAALAWPARAAQWPDRPIRLIAPDMIAMARRAPTGCRNRKRGRNAVAIRIARAICGAK